MLCSQPPHRPLSDGQDGKHTATGYPARVLAKISTGLPLYNIATV